MEIFHEQRQFLSFLQPRQVGGGGPLVGYESSIHTVLGGEVGEPVSAVNWTVTMQSYCLLYKITN